jgi:hypothetical protein
METLLYILQRLFPATISTIALAWLLSHARKKRNIGALNICFHFSNPVLGCIIVALCVIATLFFRDISQIKAPDRRVEFYIGIMLLCFFIYTLVIVLTTKITFINGFIVKKTLLSVKKMATKDIVAVICNESWQIYVLHDCHAKKMRMSYYIAGIEAELKKTLRHADWKKTDALF